MSAVYLGLTCLGLLLLWSRRRVGYPFSWRLWLCTMAFFQGSLWLGIAAALKGGTP